MYMDDLKQFAKIEKEWETLVQVIRIYSQDIGMEVGLKTAMLIIKIWKIEIIEGIKLPNQEKKIRTHGEKGKRKYWKQIPSNKRRWN